MHRPLTILLLVPFLYGVGCGGTAPTSKPTRADTITVEGWASVNGHEPFSVILLETDQRNFYVLAVEEAEVPALKRLLPARYRVTGTLYMAEWNGQSHAYLRPTAMERIDAF
ncbi:MAG: hypothetical protein ACE5G0_17635 [Rhodothermales bacterium]